MTTASIQTRDHREFLDVIDRLRSKGVSRYVDLPEIIVCGDQSAGKSSVLEAISGMTFPTKDNLCTRFPTELVLRRAPNVSVVTSITPDPEGPSEIRERLSKFRVETDAENLDLGTVVEKAREEMGLSGGKNFSTDILRVELSGPDQPHLTLVDLPGLFRAGNKEQSAADGAIVRKMARDYMARPRSIILAVVSAKSDFALQEVTDLTRNLDPEGTRTLGVITKPDTLDAGSESEVAYVTLAQNKDVVFRLGWHVLKNRNYDMRDATSAERDASETEFFGKGVWSSLDPRILGVKALKPRLSNVLRDQIMLQLPPLVQDVRSEISDCQERLARLGTARNTFAEQRRYLLRVSREVSTLIRAAVDGFYKDSFFGSSQHQTGYPNRLRAVVQNLLIDFEKDIQDHGRMRIIIEDPSDVSDLDARHIPRTKYIEEVREVIRQSKGCELPGTFNPLIISELFKEQCQPWAALAIKAKDSVVNVVSQTIQAIVYHVTLNETAAKISRWVDGMLGTHKDNLDSMVTSLLDPHINGHPITYTKDLVENVRDIQKKRHQKALQRNIDASIRRARNSFERDSSALNAWVLNLMEEQLDLTLEQHGSDSAADYMESYYKVALKKFVDDIAVLAVEQCLIRNLPSLLNAEVIDGLSMAEVAHLAAEGEQSAEERKWCTEKLAVLEDGLSELTFLDRYRSQFSNDGLDRSLRANGVRQDNIAIRRGSLDSVSCPTPTLPQPATPSEHASNPMDMAQGILASPSIRVASRNVSLCVDRVPEWETEIAVKPAEEVDSDSSMDS